MFDYIKNSNIAIELSLNPFTWYWWPKLNFLKHKMLPDYRCIHLFFLPIRLYFVLDSGRTDLTGFDDPILEIDPASIDDDA